MKTTQRLGLLILLLIPCLPATGQNALVPGVVWEPPANATQAEYDLIRMRRMGLQAVRTSIIESERLLHLADTLDLQLYQELPLEHLTASRLADTLEFAGRQLRRALSRAFAHRSARHFGLARGSDMSDSSACAVLERLAQLVQESGPEGSRTYYVTQFVDRDRCGGSVDLVLLDAVDDPDPMDRLRRWKAAHPDVPVGLGAVGTWVRSGAGSGLREKQSAEYQARYLEEQIGGLLREVGVTFFLHRWRDVRSETPSPALDLNDPYARNYGLLTIDHRTRPAYHVVSGLLTGRQTVFAFPQGEESGVTGSPLVLLGWGVIILLALLYALSPRFRHMLPRYFGAHQFYRQAVREGRDVLYGASVVMLIAIGAITGMVAALLLETMRTTDAFGVLVHWLPDGVQQLMLTLLVQPLALVILVGGIYGFILVLWTGLLSVLSRGRYLLYPGQALMLVAWPLWPLFPAMLAAMVISTLSPAEARLPCLILVIFWLLVSVGAMLRTMIDYASVTRMRVHRLIIAALFSPAVLGALAAAVAWLWYRQEILFLWNLGQSG